MNRLFALTVFLGLMISASLAMAADDCSPMPTCNGEPQCSQASDCNKRAWPLACTEAVGWWQCCNGLTSRTERCCIPHCPDVQETESAQGGDEDPNAGGSDSGGCSIAKSGSAMFGLVLLGLLGLKRRR